MACHGLTGEYDMCMPDAAPQSPCYACGYDLQGNTSGVCPECGGTAPLAIAIPDSRQFHFARAMLERDGLLLSSIEPGGSMGTMAIVEFGGFKMGWLWIDQKDADHVGELLDEHGITTNINSRPIVDRSEPNCPKCNAKLDIFGREQCSACGTNFQWVDIEVPEVDPRQECVKCGYDLRGLTSDRCPECNRDTRDPVKVVERAMGEWDGEMPQNFRDPQAKTFSRLRMAIALLVISTLALVTFANPVLRAQVLAGGLGVLVGLAILVGAGIVMLLFKFNSK
jgi:hypothetical protein